MAVTLASVDGTFVNPSTYDAGELRRADAAMFASAGIASGLAVSVNGSDVVTVTAGSAVISGEDAVTGTGVYRAGIPASVTGSLEARDATNARIDLVVFRQYDTDVVASHPRYKSEIEIIKGTPSATPTVPARPSMAVELARITVPASGGGAASVNASNRVSASAVGVDPAESSAWTAYTPALTATTTNPTLGTGGSITGAYRKVGKTVEFRVNLVSGAGPAAGSGSYQVSLPFACASAVTALGFGQIADSATVAQVLTAARGPSVSVFVMYGSSSTSVVSGTTNSLVSGRSYYIAGTYESA